MSINVNENEFFREAALRICGYLEIDKAMSSCLEYLHQFMPADRMVLQLLSPDFTTMHTIAMATLSEAISLDLVTPLSEETRKAIEEVYAAELPPVWIMCPPEKYKTAEEMLRYHNITSESALTLPIEHKEKPLGTLSVISEGSGIHTEEQARLLALLRDPFAVSLSNTLKHREVGKLKDLLADDNRYLQNELHRIAGEEIIGADFGLKRVMEMIGQVAHLSSPVLILGETGSGKELAANAVHNGSPRKNGPFIKVNCGAIPDTLMDSELFGHEKGAFTGAISQKRGRFERAHGGTIFLDEIGELPQEAQIRLLRVLQDKIIERVGGTEPIELDIRVIAATHRDLPGMVAQGQFREDLYFRLKVFPISIPPVRERRGDIPALVQYIMQKKAREMTLAYTPVLAPGAMDSLMEYHWPGNVRELENAVERALIVCREEPLSFHDLTSDETAPDASLQSYTEETVLELDGVVGNHIQKVLKMAGGRIEGKDGAAEMLKIKPGTLRHRMRKLGISFGRKK